MDLSIKKAREKIREKCANDEKYVISKFEAYILICDTASEVVKLYVYDKMEEKIRQGKADKTDLLNICKDIFGEKTPISSVVENMIAKDKISKEDVEEYKDVIESFKAKYSKKM